MREWVRVSRYAGMTLGEYMALSLHDRFHLHLEVQRFREALYGNDDLNPEEME